MCTFSEIQFFCFLFKDCLTVSKAESHRLFLFCFGEKSPPPPSPLWIRALNGARIEVALSHALPRGPLEILGGRGAEEMGRGDLFPKPKRVAAAPLPLAPISSVAQREPTQNTHKRDFYRVWLFPRQPRLPSEEVHKS